MRDLFIQSHTCSSGTRLTTFSGAMWLKSSIRFLACRAPYCNAPMDGAFHMMQGTSQYGTRGDKALRRASHYHLILQVSVLFSLMCSGFRTIR